MKLLLALSLLGIVWCTSAQNVSTANCTLTEKTVDCVICNEEGTCRNTHKDADSKTKYYVFTGEECRGDGCRVCTGSYNKYHCTYKRKEGSTGNYGFCIGSGWTTRCTICDDAECHKEIVNKFPGKRSSEEENNSSESCSDDGHTKTCTTCVNGVCNTHTSTIGKRGTTTKSCKSNGVTNECTYCTDGVCETKVTRHGLPTKRSSEEEEQINNTSTTCDNNGCTVCVNGNCHHTPDKRAIEEENNTSTTCDNNGCTVCVNGNCHHTPGKRAIAEEQVVHTSTNCGALGCVICNNGNCHLQPGKRAANGSYSKSCTNGQCVECTNGNCRHYNE